MDASQQGPSLRVKIERPQVELKIKRLPFIYYFLVMLSFLLISCTLWLLVLEWSGRPLPAFLRLSIAG